MAIAKLEVAIQIIAEKKRNKLTQAEQARVSMLVGKALSNLCIPSDAVTQITEDLINKGDSRVGMFPNDVANSLCLRINNMTDDLSKDNLLEIRAYGVELLNTEKGAQA